MTIYSHIFPGPRPGVLSNKQTSILEKYLNGKVIDGEDEWVIDKLGSISFGIDRGSPIHTGFTTADDHPRRTARTTDCGKYLIWRSHLSSDVGKVADFKRAYYKLINLFW